MNYIYLDESDARKLFLNRYLSKKTFKRGVRKKTGVLSFHFGSNFEPMEYNKKSVVFLSQFDYVNITSDSGRKVYVQNYNVPVGFFQTDSSKEKASLKFSKSGQDLHIDQPFLAFRRAMLNSFLSFYDKGLKQIDKWFELYLSLELLPNPFYELFEDIIVRNDFPIVKATGKLAKESKSVLQLIYLGSFLAKNLFKENDGLLDDAHKKWLRRLNPEEEIEVGVIPKKFQSVAELIIGYALAIQSKANKRKGIKSYESYSNSISFLNKKELEIDTIHFFQAFWSGVLNRELDNYFHVPDSSMLLLVIEARAYQVVKQTDNYDLNIIEEAKESIKKTKSDDKRILNARYSKYCELISGKKPDAKTKEDLLKSIYNYDLRSKKTLIFFLSSQSYLYRVRDIIGAFSQLKNVLLIHKYQLDTESENTDISIDLLLGKLRKEVSEYKNDIKVEVLGKNMSNDDDRDIVNNLKAYLKSYNTEKRFLFASDSMDKDDIEKEQLWLGKALSSTPLFDEEKDYIFVNPKIS